MIWESTSGPPIEYGEIRNIDFFSEKSGLMCNEHNQPIRASYLSYSEFINEFPDSISESQEALYGSKCRVLCCCHFG